MQTVITEMDIYKYVLECFGKPEPPITERVEANPYEYSRVRLRNALGTPQQYLCFDCNESSNRWSYDFCDPAEYIRTDRGTRFSINIKRYVPRCFHCEYQHNATTGKGFDPLPIPKCAEIHPRTVPVMFVDRYEFKFCKICFSYRRHPRKDYYANRQYPALKIGPTLSLQF